MCASIQPSVLLLLLFNFILFPDASCFVQNQMCASENPFMSGYYKDGDTIIGGLIAVNVEQYKYDSPLYWKPIFTPCSDIRLQTYMKLLHFVYAVEEINKRSDLLPNVTLGFHVFDSCQDGRRTMNGALGMLSGRSESSVNYNCYQKKGVIAIIENLPSLLSKQMSNTLKMYNYPQISTASRDALLSDKVQFPSNYRTVTSEVHLLKAISRLLNHFGWTWIGILAFDEGSNMKTVALLKEEIQSNGGCVNFTLTISPFTNVWQRTRKVFAALQNSTANVIVFYGNDVDHFILGRDLQADLQSVPAKIWIFTDELNVESWYEYSTFPLNGSLALVNHQSEIPGFTDFLSGVTTQRYPEDIFLPDLFEYVLGMSELANTHKLIKSDNGTVLGNLGDVVDNHYQLRATVQGYAIYNAVYSVAHAVHTAILSQHEKEGRFRETQYGVLIPLKLSQYLKKIHFTNSVGDEVFFDKNGDYMLGYDLLNWLYSGNKSQRAVHVGRFDPSASPGKEFVINESLITWNSGFKQKPPLSRCSDPCLPGNRKITLKDKAICCYKCILCPEGEISNQTDAEQCLQCLVHEWPNMKRDTCIPKEVIYLSYQEPLGAVLAFIAFFFSVSTAIVLAIFIMFRDTPIVKANNCDLSYILLLSLMLCFLCSLLFIGHPQKVTCILRQAAFGIAFTVSVSSILGKTLTVVLAFYATKPGSNIRRWIKHGVGSYLVVFCSTIQGIICFIWLFIAPPYPSYDTQSVTDQMILECSEGSTMAFYCVLGYIGLLASLCFIIAFLARNLPDSFNEAKFITFSMLVFCSVWISFIPTYLSSKGKYMAAVEIFAILASSAGLLGCIFLPKCFVIIFRPERNTKEHLSRR